ncbi:MAG TPA: hypothetical protein VFX35_09795 [Solirubrobacterales bacterium]|nr:hypothetical protein [Solirubrobacterales bacterium]
MAIRIPVVIEIDDRGIAQIEAAGISIAAREPQRFEETPASDREVELPERWQLVGKDSEVRYTWGEDYDLYDPFLTFEGTTPEGKARLAIGKCRRTRTHGRDRIYYIVVSIGPEGGMRAIAEFLATDDYEETGEVIAIIKGKDGTGRLFDSADELPPVYKDLRTVTYRDRVDYPGSYLKQGLVCDEDDAETMLNHSLAQMRLRDL